MRITWATTPSGHRLVAERGDHYRALGDETMSLVDLIRADVPLTSHLGDRVEVTRTATPVRPSKIVAVGLNYLDHVREAGVETLRQPVLFTKFPSSVISDGQEIVLNPIAARVDWEAELGVVIGREARFVSEVDALDYVFGYLAANDVSARDVQFADGQWVRGKSFDTFCPLSAAVVTRDEIQDPQNLALGTSVNGVDKQGSNTSQMIFCVAQIISFCSQAFTLLPGDVVLTGTPSGCGEFMDPKESLKSGDIVRVWVDCVGSVTSRVVEAARSAGSRVG